MTYDELEATDDLAYTVPTKVNENFRKRSFLNSVAKSADFTVLDSGDDGTGDPVDIYLVTTGASTITATLPAVADDDPTAGRIVTIMKVDGGVGSITIDGDGSETINGATTVSVSAQYGYKTLFSDGTEWFVIAD